MTLPAIVEIGLAPLAPPSRAPLSRFHIAALAFQRSRQLKQGARPRVAAEGHKVVTVALLEVLADTISWSTS
jgi:DNA-directed RNA polymerase subunit K/omega